MYCILKLHYKKQTLNYSYLLKSDSKNKNIFSIIYCELFLPIKFMF